MKCKLSPNGSGYQLYIPKQVMQLLGYVPDETKVVFVIKEQCLHVYPYQNNQLPQNRAYYIRKLVKSGNGYSFYITNTIIELLNINPEKDYLKMSINDNIMTINKCTT